METQLVNIKTPVDHVFCNRGCEERFHKYRVHWLSGTLHVEIHPTSGQVVLITHSPLARDRAATFGHYVTPICRMKPVGFSEARPQGLETKFISSHLLETSQCRNETICSMLPSTAVLDTFNRATLENK